MGAEVYSNLGYIRTEINLMLKSHAECLYEYRCTDGMVPRPTSPKQDVAVKKEEERPIDALSSLTVSSNSSSASAAFARSLFLFLGMSF